ncbi:hypothetical protein C2S52_004920 [Perilla frutescens var. hirtella]|nr:hypothetical protein C2S51_010692 [Perilla frutescens var. frutescens]KAH6794443.1 hypothetical protein C2S52_004920 [Perilla frutescens var. hirtella]
MVVEIKEKTFLSPPSQQSYSIFQQPPPSIPISQSTGYGLNNRISPSILLIIIILAVIFFISGLLHLLVRFLLRPAIRNSDEIENLTALQGQLQQLFHLHDSGVDQSFIDALPVFNYKAIIGVKDPFDCAVCLSEFEVEDKLRLLPKCSHAFHMDCIDTWLLSHSTCPICRASLVQDFNQNSNFFSPVVRVLESGMQKSGEVVVREREASGEKVVAVKLGKFRNVGGGDEGSSESSAEARRCFSMGSFAYVLSENSSLKVAITNHVKKQSLKKPRLLGHRTAMSECGCDSRREFNGFEAFKTLETQSVGDENKSISISKRDSFSVSKIWLSGRKDKRCDATMESTRRAFSFRLRTCRSPVAAGEVATKNGGGELDFDEEIGMQRCKNLESEDDHQSFGRKTLQWVMGRQNKVVHSSFSSNVQIRLS